MLVMTFGSMDIGKRMMLKSDRDTKAFSASRTLSESDRVYTANVVRDTCNTKQSTETQVKISSTATKKVANKQILQYRKSEHQGDTLKIHRWLVLGTLLTFKITGDVLVTLPVHTSVLFLISLFLYQHSCQAL